MPIFSRDVEGVLPLSNSELLSELDFLVFKTLRFDGWGKSSNREVVLGVDSVGLVGFQFQVLKPIVGATATVGDL
jgi:hypothetical protein